MTATLIAVGILLLAGLVVILLLVRSARGRRGPTEDVPPGMRPAYSDEQLEQRVRYRYLAWGGALTIFFAVFLPVYWLTEASRLQAETEGFFTVAVAEGGDLYRENCAECHGANGEGGAAPSPYDPSDAWVAPNLTTIAARYEDSRIISDIHDYVYTTIERGRPGTPMPTWGAAYGGPLTDQQIEDITTWILANQTVPEGEEETAAAELTGQELYVENCAKCHGPDGQGLVGPSLVGVFERHTEESVLGILRNGILLTNITMPPWQNGYMYPGTKFSDKTLREIVAYLHELQPAQLPEDAQQYQTPGLGPLPGPDASPSEPGAEPTTSPTEEADA